MKKRDIVLPNYKDGSIVNLMSSIGKNFGWKSPYGQLKELPAKELKNSKNIVLMIIDGLGYEYLKTKGKKSTLAKYLRGSMTSVFPSTTTAAIPTYLSGLPPQQTGLTGWNINLKEAGVVTSFLPYVTSKGKVSITEVIDISETVHETGFPQKIKTKSFIINHKDFYKKGVSELFNGKAKLLPYGTLSSFFSQTKKAIKSRGKKYVYAYWPTFDTYAHEGGYTKKKVHDHFKLIDKKFKSFLKAIEGFNTTMIVSADHGHMIVDKKKVTKIKDHPKFWKMLSLPKCGERRFAYFYVKAAKQKEFEKYCKTKLKKVCDIYESEDFIKKKMFGLGKQSYHLDDRIGDYVMIMKPGHVIVSDKLHLIGDHGGLTKEEMLVPLIVVKV